MLIKFLKINIFKLIFMNKNDNQYEKVVNPEINLNQENIKTEEIKYEITLIPLELNNTNYNEIDNSSNKLQDYIEPNFEDKLDHVSSSHLNDQSNLNLGPEYSSVIYGKIRLNLDITATNYYGSLLSSIVVGLIGSVISTLEPLWLLNQLNISQENIGTTEIYLYLIDYLYQIVIGLIFGGLVDYFGRRSIFGIGVVFGSLGLSLIQLSNSVISYAFIKAIASTGLCIMGIVPLQHD